MQGTQQYLASRWKRLGAVLIDGIIGVTILFPVAMYLGSFQHLAQGEPMTLEHKLIINLLGMAIYFAINIYLLAKQGQTVGKKLLDIRIVSHRGGGLLPLSKVYVIRHLLFHVISLIPGLSLILIVDGVFIFRKDKRCIHDLLAGSKVVNAN